MLNILSERKIELIKFMHALESRSMLKVVFYVLSLLLVKLVIPEWK